MRFRTRESDDAINAIVTDLSQGGLFVHTTTAVQVGTFVAGAFLAPRRLIGFRGRVAWIAGADSGRPGRGFGVRFTRADVHDLPTTVAPSQDCPRGEITEVT